MTKEEVWVKCAAAIIATGGCRDDSSIAAGAAIADQMVAQWGARFGDGAFLLEGQTECASCHKDLPEGATFTHAHGIKYCDAPSCMQKGPDMTDQPPKAKTVMAPNGQSECATCHRPLEPSFIMATDNVAFCNSACLVASGREEES
jgi:hypothetical protein